MFVSEFKEEIQGEIVRDGEFHTFQHSCTIIESSLTFLDDESFVEQINANSHISVVFVKPELVNLLVSKDIGLVVCENPRIAFFTFFNYLAPLLYKSKFDFDSVIDSTADVRSALVSKKGVIIGAGSIIGENTIIYPGTRIGSNCVIGAANILGGEGFEYKRSLKTILRVKHFGDLVIDDFVDTKEFVSMHRSLFDGTITHLGEYTKVDAHVHIGHANLIGKRVLLCSKVSISGNSKVCDDSYVGPGVNIPNRIIVSNNTKITIGSTLSKSTMPFDILSGHFAITHSKYLEHIKRIDK